jgi:hypothetical protein
MWRVHPLRVRRWHRLAEGLPRLLTLVPAEAGAELVLLLRRIVRRVVQGARDREWQQLARELPSIISRIIEDTHQ